MLNVNFLLTSKRLIKNALGHHCIINKFTQMANDQENSDIFMNIQNFLCLSKLDMS